MGFTPISSTATKPLPFPIQDGSAEPSHHHSQPSIHSLPHNPPGSSCRNHFPFGPKTQAVAKVNNAGFQNRPYFLMKMSPFWPSQ